MIQPPWPPKDPDETLDYSIEWADRMVDDTIVSVLWTVPAGLTKESEVRVDTLTTVFLSGGTLGEAYIVGCRVTTADGRILDDTGKVKIKSR